MNSRPAPPVPVRWLALLASLVLGGCGLFGSEKKEPGELTLMIEPTLVNYHSMAISWTTTFTDTITLRYRLYIWYTDSVQTKDVPSWAYFELTHHSSGADRVIPVTGLAPLQTFYTWIAAYRQDPDFRIIRETERLSFTTCASPYTSLSRSPRTMSGHRAASLNDVFYIVWPNRAFERFDPTTNELATLPDVPHAHTDFGMAASGGKLYVIGGASSSEIDMFDPATRTWGTCAPVPLGISVRTAVTLRDTIYAFASSDQLSGSHSWADYPTGRKMMAYAPATNTWLARADRPGQGKVMGPVVPFQGRLYLFGSYASGEKNYGFIQASLSDSIFTYDPDANRWSYHDNMPDGRVGFRAVVSLGHIYLIGGVLERLDSSEEIWSVPPILSYNGATQGWSLKTLPSAPLDFGEDGAAVTVGPTIYFVNGGNRWPGLTGSYVPENDNCGFDIMTWDDTIPYGIPFTATSKPAVGQRPTMGAPHSR